MDQFGAGTLEDGDADRREIHISERIVPGDGSWAVSSAGSDCVRQREDQMETERADCIRYYGRTDRTGSI